MKPLFSLILIINALRLSDNTTHFKEYRKELGSFICVSAAPNGYIVAANKEGVVYLWDQRGSLIGKQSYSQYGKIDLIDAANPLDIFIYFKLNRRLIVLDNQLNVKKELDFNKLQNYQVRGLGRASDGNCWIIDAREQLLKKIDFTGKALQSQTILLNRTQGGFVLIRDNGNHVVCGADQDSMLNIYTSSLLLGVKLKKGKNSWCLYGNEIFVPLNDSILGSYDIASPKTDTIHCMGNSPLKQVQVYSGGLVNMNAGNLIFYKSEHE
ncbi:MAG: hypothetical protein RL160_72 [Bacteroidota bacterium]|jgi:hypothetical protein